MIDSKYRISLDVNSTTSNVRLKCKRCDTGRTIYAALTESGYPYHITDDCYAVFTATKPDGKKVYNGCKIEGCAIVYELTPQTVAVPGLVKCEIKLYGANDKLITSASFLLEVYNAQVNDGDELESEQEVTALTRLISDSLNAVEESRKTTERGADIIKKLNESEAELSQKAISANDAADRAGRFADDASSHSVNAQSAADDAKSAEASAKKYAEAAKSHRATVQRKGNGVVITMSDSYGTTSETVMDGNTPSMKVIRNETGKCVDIIVENNEYSYGATVYDGISPIVFDGFPDEFEIAGIDSGDCFDIRGLATYRVIDTPSAFYIPYMGRYICPVGVTADCRDIHVDRYGIRRSAGGSYAAENSAIMAAIISSLTNGYTLHFGSGHYYFSEPIKAQKQDGTQLHMCIKGVCSNAAVVVEAVNYGTYLHFPDLADGQAGIDIPGGVAEDIGIVGNPSVCAMTLDRSKVITDPANAIKLTDKGTTYGIRAGAWGYNVHNVRVRNCTIGVWGETSNSIVDGVDANQCKIGVSVGNDTKVRNVKAWHAMVAVQLRGQLASATGIRGDSIGSHLIECWSGKCILSDIDGDFVMRSLIHYGDGTPRFMHLGQATGCMGRVATKLAYSRKGSFDLRAVPAADYDKCSYISIAPYTQVFGGHIEVANAKANIYDAVSDYVHPDAPISIGAGSTVKGVTVVCNVPSSADLEYFDSKVIKNLSTNAQAENDANGYLTDFDGKVIEDINFVTPIGFVRSRRTLAAPERTLEFSKDANGALLVEEQALSEPQKAQVWKNLGLDGISSLAFVDSIDKCTDSSKTYVLPDGRTVAYAEKPSYTNKLPTSSDGAGGVYNAAETPGYSTGYVGSGGVVQPATKWYVTGFIPIRPNDVIRMQNLRFMETDTGVIASGDSKASFHFYDASYKYLLSSASYGPDNLPSAAWAPQYDATGNLVECKVPSSYNSAIRYMRLCVRSINADSIISVNEVIGPPTVEFGDTGLRFVTEEMYNKIIALMGA